MTSNGAPPPFTSCSARFPAIGGCAAVARCYEDEEVVGEHGGPEKRGRLPRCGKDEKRRTCGYISDEER